MELSIKSAMLVYGVMQVSSIPTLNAEEKAKLMSRTTWTKALTWVVCVLVELKPYRWSFLFTASCRSFPLTSKMRHRLLSKRFRKSGKISWSTSRCAINCFPIFLFTKQVVHLEHYDLGASRGIL
jgi:hypothetical protein